MRLFASAVVVAASLVASAALAAPKPGDWVYDQTAAVLEEAAARDLRDPADPGPPDQLGVPPAAMFTRIDVNHDGVEDWRVNYEFAPNASLWCGTGGCRNDIWVSEEGHHHDRFMSVGARDFKLSRKGGVTRLDLDFHGSACGGYGAQACARSYVWTEGGFVETPAKGQTWLTGGPVQLEPARLSDMPAVATAALERLQMQCGVNNGTFDPQWQVQSIPDLDGDGFRDWVIGGPYSTCEYSGQDITNVSPTLPMQVFVTGGAMPEGKLAFSSTGAAYGIDIGSEPAAFFTIADGGEGCEYMKPCGKRLRWDEASGKLVEQE